jgi:hypothetical protein
MDEVLALFRDNALSYLNCWPKIGERSDADESLFAETSLGNAVERVAAQLPYLGSISRGGGLFVMVGRKDH